MHGDIPAACPCSAGSRCDRPVTSSHTCSRSVSDPSVATTPSPTAPDGSASVQAAGISDLLPSGSTSSNSTAPCRRIPPNTGNDLPCSGWRGRVILTADGRSSRPVVRRGFVRSDRPRPVTRRDRRLPRPGDDRRLVEGGRVRTGQGLRPDRGGNSAGRCDDSFNAVGNFCFEVSLSYRRVELPRRVSATV